MDHDVLVACIGKAEDSPEVQKVLSALGVTKKLKMPKDDIDVRHSLHKLGLCLIFKPEAPKSSRLVLNAVQFVSSAEEDYSTFAGALPGGLQFSDGPAEAHAKLGTPLVSKPKMRLDIWKLNHLELGIDYCKDEPHQVAVVTVDVPRGR